jgi:hypothetical protein
MSDKQQEIDEMIRNITEKRKLVNTEEPAAVLRDRQFPLLEGWKSECNLDVTITAGTTVTMELNQHDCYQYDIPMTWIGEKACFASVVVFDDAYTAHEDSFLEFEFMTCVDADLNAVLGVRDISSHCEYVKRGITIEIDQYDEHRSVKMELIDEFALELIHLDDDAQLAIDNMMDFQMQVLQGGTLLTMFRYFEEYAEMEVNA